MADLPDLTRLVRRGDLVAPVQGSGEPRTLTEALVAQRHELRGARVLLGATWSGTFRPEHADALSFTAIGGIGTNRALADAGVLDVLPCHISAFPRLLADRRIAVDVALVQVAPAGPDGLHALGLVGDYVGDLVAAARVVVAEVNPRVPRTAGPCRLAPSAFDLLIESDRDPVEVAAPEPDAAGRTIGEHIAALVPDGATIQLGVGALPHAIARALRGHRRLSVHSGAIGDWLVDLEEAGAVTNDPKPVDTGRSVTGACYGTRRLYDHLGEHPEIELHPLTHTHAPAVLSRFERFFAINGALEVDLTGQVNAETLDGRHVGAVGGQLDFVRAATSSAAGRSIIALPSTARGGSRSRIVARLPDGVVTTPRSDADLVVTEHGVADLRGTPVGERVRRMLAIVDPAHREAVERAAHELGAL